MNVADVVITTHKSMWWRYGAGNADSFGRVINATTRAVITPLCRFQKPTRQCYVVRVGRC